MRTPLHQKHLELGAKMINFADWEMPVSYSGIIAEHNAVRTRAGLFDVSHMGEIFIEGSGALDFVQYIGTNDAAGLAVGSIQYTFLCNENGGIIDDCTLYRFAKDRFLFVVNAANKEKDLAWIVSQKNPVSAKIKDQSNALGLIALQGPLSQKILEKVAGFPLVTLKYYHFRTARIFDVEMCISRTGYTGEDGFELYCESDKCAKVWDWLMGEGVRIGLVPCGLGARDTLRLEAGMALHGNDIDEQRTPLEAGLEKFVKLRKSADFIGKHKLTEQSKDGVQTKLVGFIAHGEKIPRHGYTIHSEKETLIGCVTSGSYSPSFKKGLGMGYVEVLFSKPGTKLLIRARDKYIPAEVVRLPFYKRSKEVKNENIV